MFAFESADQKVKVKIAVSYVPFRLTLKTTASSQLSPVSALYPSSLLVLLVPFGAFFIEVLVQFVQEARRTLLEARTVP